MSHTSTRLRALTGALAASALAGAALVAAGGTPALAADAPTTPTPTLSVLATTDVHGHVFDWDYFSDKAPAAGKDYGLSRLASAVDKVRDERGSGSVLLLDNGDSIQGTPLTYLAAKQPALLTGGATHPMAQAYDDMGYDVQNLGNHEFNYGLTTLQAYEDELNAPLLGANVVKAGTDVPAFTPYEIVDKTVDGHTVKVGVLGVVTPGIRIWDKANVQGTLEFRDPTATAQKYVPLMKAEGADIIVVLAHTGMGATTTWDPAALEEDTAQFLTTKVDGIDVVIGGHTHRDVPAEVTHSPDGTPVLYTQPVQWAGSLSDVQLPLTFDSTGTPSIAWPASDDPTGDKTIAGWVTKHAASALTDSTTITGDPVLTQDHEDTLAYVNTVIAQSSVDMSAATSRYEDTPILDLIGKVMVDTVTAGIKGTAAEGLPVIAQVSPFSRDAVFHRGSVTIKDVAGLYIYDNTLLGVEVTGAQVRDYLEYSAKYFTQVDEGATFDPTTGTNAVVSGKAVPDYNYDVLTGVTYWIDVSQPVGNRIEGLSFRGRPVGDSDRFVLAINNYRQSGGGGYPHVADAPVVYDKLVEIRQQMIDDAVKAKVIDPSTFFVQNWALTTTPIPAPSPSTSPSATPSASSTPTRTVQASPSPSGLAATGADSLVLAGLVAALAISGCAVLAVRRRVR